MYESNAYLILSLAIRPMPDASKHDKTLSCLGYLVIWMETSEPPDQKPSQISLYRNIWGEDKQINSWEREKKRSKKLNMKKMGEMECKLPLDLANWMGRVSEVWVWDNLWSAGESASLNRACFSTVAPGTWHARSAQTWDPRPPRSEERVHHHPRTPTCSAPATFWKHFGDS